MNSPVQSWRGTWPQIALPALPPRVRQGLSGLRRRALRHRRIIAATGSVLLHLLLLLALFSHAPKGLPGGGSGGTAVGAGTGETYAAIDLYTLPPAPAATTAVKTPDDPATETLDKPTQTVKPQPETIQTATTMSQPAALPEVAPATPAEASAAAQPATAGGVGQAGTTSGAGDDLWKAIAPCWGRVAGKDTLPVALRITFGATGGLSKPPQIVRDDKAPITPQSLHSEAQALSALAQCGGYPMAANRQEVEVHFPRPD